MMGLNPVKGQSPPLWMCQPRGDIPESLSHLPTYQLQPTQSLCLSLAGCLTTPTPVAFSRSPPPPPCIAHSWRHISSEIWKLTLKPTTSSKEPPLIKWGRRTLQCMTDKSPINENTHTHPTTNRHSQREKMTHSLLAKCRLLWGKDDRFYTNN